MSTIKNLSRLGAVLASLAIIAVSLASSASASTSMFPEPGSDGGTGPVTPAPVTEVHTVIVGGMPGWQIALIAVVAALFTAIAAVLVERSRTARRRAPRPLADSIL